MEIPHSISGLNVGGFGHTAKLKPDAAGADAVKSKQLVLPSATPGLEKSDSGKSEPTVRSTLLAGLLCSNTTLSQDPESKQWVPKGNSSEAPLVVGAAKVGFWGKDTDLAFPRVLEIPFNSSRKMMLTVVKLDGGEAQAAKLGDGGIKVPAGAKFAVFVKGAPNIILDACAFSCTRDDSNVPEFGKSERNRAMDVVDQLSSQALRVLAVATRFFLRAESLCMIVIFAYPRTQLIFCVAGAVCSRLTQTSCGPCSIGSI